ncbi:hypothetical protein MTO96_017494 [Rhipicephalus appendiculatus]
MLVYVSGLLCGPLAQWLLNPDAFIAGSSSGVYSLQTAHLAHVLTNIRDMELVGLRIPMLLLVYLNDLYSIVRGPPKPPRPAFELRRSLRWRAGWSGSGASGAELGATQAFLFVTRIL